MKKLLFVTLLLTSMSAMAVDVPKDAKGCLACHSVEKKVVGPAWKDVAAKRSEKEIAANIKAGGKFGWNMGMMPAKGGNAKLTDEQIAGIAKFISELK